MSWLSYDLQDWLAWILYKLGLLFLPYFFKVWLFLSPKDRIKTSLLLACPVPAPASKCRFCTCKAQPYRRAGVVQPHVPLFCSLAFIGSISSCQEGLFFVGEKLLAGRRDGWIIVWDGTLKLKCYLSPVQRCSCIPNSAVVFLHELFRGECLWDRLSMENVPGFWTVLLVSSS